VTAPTHLIVQSTAQMEQLGARIARQLRAGDLVMLGGALGAGKTTLARGLGAELGVRGAVTSPTFVLARTHPRLTGEAPLVHVDAHRLGSAAEGGAAALDDLDIDYASSIVVIEWGAGLVDGVTDSWLTVDIVRPHGGEPQAEEELREVTLTGHGPRWERMEWAHAASN
jgi:tRNA threonylcarbamoyladenosine biosynthesis protein TsaE